MVANLPIRFPWSAVVLTNNKKKVGKFWKMWDTSIIFRKLWGPNLFCTSIGFLCRFDINEFDAQFLLPIFPYHCDGFIDLLISLFINLLIDLFTDLFIGLLIDWLIDWLFDSSVDVLVVWLIDYWLMIDWLINIFFYLDTDLFNIA